MALSDNLIGLWTPWLGATGYRLIDRSPYYNHATLNNMDATSAWVASTIRGQSGHSLAFDGSNDFAPLTRSNLITLAPTRVCIAVWVYPRQSANRNTYLADWDTGGSNESFRLEMTGFNITTGRIGGNILLSGGNNPVQTSATVTLNQWHCIALQRTRAGQELYWNGVLDASNTAGVAATASNNPIVLGRAGSFNGLYANAQFAMVSIWNRDLSASEHLELFRLGAGWFAAPKRKRYAFVTGVTFNRRRRILCGDYN